MCEVESFELTVPIAKKKASEPARAGIQERVHSSMKKTRWPHDCRLLQEDHFRRFFGVAVLFDGKRNIGGTQARYEGSIPFTRSKPSIYQGFLAKIGTGTRRAGTETGTLSFIFRNCSHDCTISPV